MPETGGGVTANVHRGTFGDHRHALKSNGGNSCTIYVFPQKYQTISTYNGKLWYVNYTSIKLLKIKGIPLDNSGRNPVVWK